MRALQLDVVSKVIKKMIQEQFKLPSTTVILDNAKTLVFNDQGKRDPSHLALHVGGLIVKIVEKAAQLLMGKKFAADALIKNENLTADQLVRFISKTHSIFHEIVDNLAWRVLAETYGSSLRKGTRVNGLGSDRQTLWKEEIINYLNNFFDQNPKLTPAQLDFSTAKYAQDLIRPVENLINTVLDAQYANKVIGGLI